MAAGTTSSPASPLRRRERRALAPGGPASLWSGSREPSSGLASGLAPRLASEPVSRLAPGPASGLASGLASSSGTLAPAVAPSLRTRRLGAGGEPGRVSPILGLTVGREATSAATSSGWAGTCSVRTRGVGALSPGPSSSATSSCASLSGTTVPTAGLCRPRPPREPRLRRRETLDATALSAAGTVPSGPTATPSDPAADPSDATTGRRGSPRAPSPSRGSSCCPAAHS